MSECEYGFYVHLIWNFIKPEVVHWKWKWGHDRIILNAEKCEKKQSLLIVVPPEHIRI